MPKPSRLQRVIVLAIVLIAGFQLFSVTTAAIPANSFSTRAKPVTSYLNPFFTQNWRLFAPNPISSDRSLWFRGEYVDASGDTKTTTWLNWTDVELDLVHHKVVGGRAGYITNKLIGPLNDRFLAMSLPQRKVAADDKATALKGYSALRKKLLETDGKDPRAVELYLSYETSTIRLATSAMRALHPGVTFAAIRYRVVSQSVVPYADRGLTAEQRKQVRPGPMIRRSGWRAPIVGSTVEQKTIASFLRRHR